MLRHRPATLRQKPDPRSDTHRDRQVRSGQGCDPRRERQVTGIELRLTDFADEVENAKLATAFAGVATSPVRPYSSACPGPRPQSGSNTCRLGVAVYLVTNARLAFDDRNIALDEQAYCDRLGRVRPWARR
jgi:hypothetical protein